MKNKKGGAGIIIGIIAGVLVMGVIVTLLIIASQKGWFDGKKQEQPIPMINLYLKATDKDSGTQVEANYVLEYGGKRFSEGVIESKDWTELKVPQSLISVYCWNKDHYLIKASKIFSPEEIQANSSKFSCDMVRFSNLSISSLGNLQEGISTITLNISTTEWFYRPIICASWTAGIIYVQPTNELLTCDAGNWVNWSFYNATTKQYVLLPQNQYRCGEDKIEDCEAVEGNKCRLLSTEIPRRYKPFKDKCWNLGESFYNSAILKEFTVKMENPNQLDMINFTIIDRDRRFSAQNQDWEWATEDSTGSDISEKDSSYVVTYNQ